jgi:dihydroflavonol-4-reductase
LTGKWRSVKEIATVAEGITGKKRPALVTPMWLARGWAPFQAAFDRMQGRRPLYTSESLEALRANKQVDHGKAERELDHHPRPAEESIKDIYAWFEQAGKLS